MSFLSRLTALALVCLVASPALAEPFSPLTVNTKIPGLRQPFAGITFTNSEKSLKDLISAYGKRFSVKSIADLHSDEVQCGLAKFGVMFVKNLMLNEIPGMKSADLEGFPKALEHYKAREEFFCNKPPPPGVKANRGAELMRLWMVRVMDESAKAREQELAATYTARAKQRGFDVTARDVAMAVGIGLAMLAGDLLPIPVP
ncbi:hypothetical protein [Corallococcus exiguus]|uniref:hypothetical protein n=1 Tax=Corallococcus exiguus TaxID=83462 RepID=UPI0014726492|nr:hypothetical protein [Corallococcus exiguus]NNB90526.1 hypothetical protein [Corallococcus exiguus]